MDNYNDTFLLPLRSARWMEPVSFAAPGMTSVPATATDTSAPIAATLPGLYTLAGGEKDGKKIPAEQLQGSITHITEHTITTFDKNKQQIYAVTYELDTSTTPWQITITSLKGPVTGEVARGLIEKNGDMVKLVYAERGGEIPTDFTSADKQLLFIFQKAH